MEYSPRYRLLPTQEQRQTLDYTLDTVRQIYNHGLYRFNQIPESEGTVKQRVRKARDELPQLKNWWTELTDVYSKVLQTAIERIATNIARLGKLKQNGHKVGQLKWKSAREFQSFTYNQSGFKLNKTSGPDNRAILELSKLGDIPVRLHRDLPDHEKIKEVTIKKESTGAWYASFCITTETPEKPPVDSLDERDCVGIDLGVLNFVTDSEGHAVSRLDLTEERERLERAQRALSRKEYESNNWERQRRVVAQRHTRMSNQKRDFKHKLAHYYATEYKAVFVEDLDVKPMLESSQNARNKAEVGWSDFLTILEHHCKKQGSYFVKVDARNTTRECASCGISTEKPLWVREHSCPSCGFELDRDWNASLNVLQRGLSELGVVHSDGMPVETEAAVDLRRVSASLVTEAGSSVLKEPPTAASRAE